MELDIRYSKHPEDYKHYDTETLRRNYLIENVFVPDEIKLTYSHQDRIIAGGAMPVSGELVLCSANFWLRCIGWFLVAMADIIEICAEDAAREGITDVFREAIDGVAAYMDETSHMFWQVVDCGKRDGNYLETSGSSMIAYAMLKGARLGVIDAKYSEIGKSVFDGICEKYLISDGEIFDLGGICLVAGLGTENNRRRDGSYEYYISEPVVQNDERRSFSAIWK